MRIYPAGETTYDILFRANNPVGANSGGSAFNSAISLGRCGLPVSLISTFGNDPIGKHALAFLLQNSVDCNLITQFDGQSRIALAFFDTQNNANYNFYPASKDAIPQYPNPHPEDIILLGSSFALRDNGRSELLNFLSQAQKNSCITIYDPNAREPVANKPDIIKKIIQNITLATILKGSDQDFTNIFGLCDSKSVYSKISEVGKRVLIYTKGSAGAELLFGDLHLEIPARETDVVSTIGAGDNFSAGIIFGICQKVTAQSSLDTLTREEWADIMNYGALFASAVCSSSENYIPHELATILKSGKP